MQLLKDILWSLPTLKGLAMHNVLVFWKNSHFYEKNCILHFFTMQYLVILLIT